MTQTVIIRGEELLYPGQTVANDGDTVALTGDVSRYDTFMLLSTTGAMHAYGSLDGTHFSTDPISLTDMGSTSTNPVVVTAAGRLFGFRGKFAALQILQSGATAVTNATLTCGRML